MRHLSAGEGGGRGDCGDDSGGDGGGDGGSDGGAGGDGGLVAVPMATAAMLVAAPRLAAVVVK